MTNYTAISSIGNIQAGETDYLWLPGEKRGANKYGVVLLHGAGAPNNFMDATRLGSLTLPAWLAMAGIPVVAGQMGGDTFANDTAMTRINSAITYLSANAGVPSTKVILIGASMGGALALRYASLNPSKVAAIVGIIPLTNINTIYQSNAGGLRAAIGTAWGVTYPTALPAGANLPVLASALNGVVPSRLYYSDADALIPYADVLAMASIAGSEAIEYDPTNSGHTETTIGAVQNRGNGFASEIIEYIKRYGA